MSRNRQESPSPIIYLLRKTDLTNHGSQLRPARRLEIAVQQRHLAPQQQHRQVRLLLVVLRQYVMDALGPYAPAKVAGAVAAIAVETVAMRPSVAVGC